MGMRITTGAGTFDPAGGAQAYPLPVALVLTCDGDHGLMLLPPTEQRFEHPLGYIAMHAMAMRAGWIERQDANRGRIWLGPCCSGKTGRETK